jgi:hypothetical protein
LLFELDGFVGSVTSTGIVEVTIGLEFNRSVAYEFIVYVLFVDFHVSGKF